MDFFSGLFLGSVIGTFVTILVVIAFNSGDKK